MTKWNTPRLMSLKSGSEAFGKIPLGFEWWIIGEHQDTPDGES